jgi:DNA mismatch endonuclease (patch repair protein)
MRRVRQRDTTPEQAVRRTLRQLGSRYRVCSPSLPGRPDIANQRHRWAIFVHGCFWHAHRRCPLATIPKSNTAFWRSKFAANRRRDTRKEQALRSLDFRVLVVWQCELANDETLEKRLAQFVAKGGRP